MIAGAIFDAVRRRAVPWFYLFGIVFVIVSGFARQSLARNAEWSAWVAGMLA